MPLPAAEAAGSVSREALVDALESVRVVGPQGVVEMDAATHHASVNSFLACCNADGSLRIIVQDFGRIPPQYSGSLPVAEAGLPACTNRRPSPEVAARLAAKYGAARLRIDNVSAHPFDCRHGDHRHRCNGSLPNPTAVPRMFGYSTDELLGMSIHLLLPPHFRQRHAELLQGFVNGEESERRMSGRQEVMGYRKDGSFFPLEASIAKFRMATTGCWWSPCATSANASGPKRN
jgi:hypothetical protein